MDKYLEYIASHLSAFAVLVAAGVILLIFLCLRKEIKGLINRWGVPKSDNPQQQQPLQQNEPSHLPDAMEVLPDNAYAKNISEKVISAANSQPTSQEKKIENLAIALTNAATRYEAEVTYRSIYGSQLEALLTLRKDGPQALAKFHEIFLERIKEKYPGGPPTNAKLDFEAWVGWLVKNGIIEMSGGLAKITPKGDALIEYIGAMGLSYDRMF